MEAAGEGVGSAPGEGLTAGAGEAVAVADFPAPRPASARRQHRHRRRRHILRVVNLQRDEPNYAKGDGNPGLSIHTRCPTGYSQTKCAARSAPAGEDVRHRIVTLAAPGVTAAKPAQSQPRSAKKTMFLKRLEKISRTGRLEAAARARSTQKGQHRRNEQLITANQKTHEQEHQGARIEARSARRNHSSFSA